MVMASDLLRSYMCCYIRFYTYYGISFLLLYSVLISLCRNYYIYEQISLNLSITLNIMFSPRRDIL